MASEINIGSIGLLIMVISVSMAEVYKLANCKDGDNKNVDKCSCPEGEVMADPSGTGFRCFPRDHSCEKDEYNNIRYDGIPFCACFEYAKESGDCVSICGSCDNGFCSSPKKCTCNPGYRTTSEGKCQPICANGCQNGICVAPGKCNCNRGYVMSKAHICEPVCSGGCPLNAKCISPEKCSCETGFLISKANKCEIDNTKIGSYWDGSETD